MVARGRHRHLRALSAVAGIALGCGTAPDPKRVETYVDVVQARVRAALEQPRLLLRHNPAGACGCPQFEVKLGDHWQRAQIGGEEDDPAIVTLLQLAGGDAPARPPGWRDRRVFEVEARLDETVSLCGRGGLYVSLVPVAFVGVVGATTAP